MVELPNRDRAKNLTVDEDDEKTLHQRIEMTTTRRRKIAGEAFIENEFMKCGAKLSHNFLLELVIVK